MKYTNMYLKMINLILSNLPFYMQINFFITQKAIINDCRTYYQLPGSINDNVNHFGKDLPDRENHLSVWLSSLSRWHFQALLPKHLSGHLHTNKRRRGRITNITDFPSFQALLTHLFHRHFPLHSEYFVLQYSS